MKMGYKGKLKSGRPTTREATNKKISEALKISEEEKVRIIDKLEEAATWDYTIQEKCFYAGISHDTYDRWRKDNPELGVKIELLRNSPVMTARKTIAKKVGDSFANSIEYLKRKRKQEFSERQEMTGADGNSFVIQISEAIAKKNGIDPNPDNNSK